MPVIFNSLDNKNVYILWSELAARSQFRPTFCVCYHRSGEAPCTVDELEASQVLGSSLFIYSNPGGGVNPPIDSSINWATCRAVLSSR